MEQEKNVLQTLIDCWNEFIKLEPQYPDEQKEFAEGISKCQQIIGMRFARESKPDLFPMLAPQSLKATIVETVDKLTPVGIQTLRLQMIETWNPHYEAYETGAKVSVRLWNKETDSYFSSMISHFYDEKVDDVESFLSEIVTSMNVGALTVTTFHCKITPESLEQLTDKMSTSLSFFEECYNVSLKEIAVDFILLNSITIGFTSYVTKRSKGAYIKDSWKGRSSR